MKCFFIFLRLRFYAASIALFYVATTLDGYEELESNSEDFVISTGKIAIPGHPHAFNPSIVRWNGSLLMSFREIVEPAFPPSRMLHSAGESIIGLVRLDEQFQPSGEAQILSLSGPGPFSNAEDGRLLTVGESLYLIYSNNINKIITEHGFRMHIAQLDHNGDRFFIKEDKRITRFENEKPGRREKNWIPFDYNGNLLMIYSISPHHILYPVPGDNECQTIGFSDKRLEWGLGELRGGTPALSIGDRYLSIFHSCVDMISEESEGKQVLHYFMGAYTFSKEPPFEITAISARPIIAQGFYSGQTYTPYWKPVRVVFPCGLLAEGPYLWVAYGRQDHEIWIAQIDKEGLLDSLRSYE